MPNQIELCTWKGCTKPASHNFRWEWGEEGKCCPECVPLVQQTAGNLSRSVQVTALHTPADSPLTRSERIALTAEKLTAEAERDESQRRGHELYKSNVELTQQVQTHKLREREHAAQLKLRDDKITELASQLGKRDREVGELSSEVQRLTTLSGFAKPPSGEQQSRVGESRRPKGPTQPPENPPGG